MGEVWANRFRVAAMSFRKTMTALLPSPAVGQPSRVGGTARTDVPSGGNSGNGLYSGVLVPIVPRRDENDRRTRVDARFRDVPEEVVEERRGACACTLSSEARRYLRNRLRSSARMSVSPE